MPERLLKAEQIAAIFGVKPNTIYQWRRRGKLPGHTINGSRILRFKKSEAMALLEERAAEKN